MGALKKNFNKKFVFQKGSHKAKCAYMLMLIRQKYPDQWVKLKQEFGNLKDEQSFEFYEKLVAIYKGVK